MIPQKQQSTQEDWSEAVRLAYESPNIALAERLVEQGIHEIRKLEHRFGDLTLSWSGGKDSQALRYVAEAAGIESSVLVISEVEWPAFLQWATDNMPWNLTIIQRPIGLDYLKTRPEMVFPDGKNAARWFSTIQHRGQRQYMKSRKADSECLIMGRRRKDGNFISRDDNNFYYDRQGEFWRASPICDWSHEDVLAVLGAYNLPIPPCYEWPRGFRVGTGSWPARQWCETKEFGWDEVFSIDASVVVNAADAGLDGAAEAIARNQG